MEIELNDLKSRIDSDVIESRALEEQASAIPQLEVLYLAPSTFCRPKNGTHCPRTHNAKAWETWR